MNKTNAEVLREALEDFGNQEGYAQEITADYIACPSAKHCLFDGTNSEVCVACKVKWLQEEWED